MGVNPDNHAEVEEYMEKYDPTIRAMVDLVHGVIAFDKEHPGDPRADIVVPSSTWTHWQKLAQAVMSAAVAKAVAELAARKP